MSRKSRYVFNSNYYSERLQKKMNILASSPAAVIEAPSGYGKTTAIRDYLKVAEEQGDKIYWFTAVDESPMALYRRLSREIGKIDNRAGERLHEIDFPNAFTIGETCDVLRSIECSKNTWLVLDDFQFMHHMLPLPFLTALFNHRSNALHIIIITQPLGREFLPTIVGLGIPFIITENLQWESEDICRYFNLAGTDISKEEACEIERITGGWVIAVHLQLRARQETGIFSSTVILQLMEHLVWNKLTSDQQDFYMRAFVFETCTIKRMCSVLNSRTLPDYALDSLSAPFIRYFIEQQRYEPHALLLRLVNIKRRAMGRAFEIECLTKAGDICRDEGDTTEALHYYVQIKDYKRILSLDLACLLEIGDGTFFDVALDIVQNCPGETRREYIFSMLCVAWAIKLMEKDAEFELLMAEIDVLLPETGLLRAEWVLLSVYQSFPFLEKMLPRVRHAAILFEGSCSRVILPDTPWAFYEYLQLSAFHIKLGAADQEADMLEEFIGIYSWLTKGHGSGADALFRAELAFYRCETAEAEILAYKALFLAESNRQKIIQIGSARVLASIAVLKADPEGWQHAVDAVEQAASGSAQNTSMFRTLLDVVRGTLLVQVRDYDRIADWLKNIDFMAFRLPVSIHNKALEVHGHYLMGKAENARLIGFSQSFSLEKHTAFSEHFHFCTMAVGYASLGDRNQAIACLERSAEKALPDRMLHCFVGYSRLLKGLSDEFIKNRYPHFFDLFNEYKERYYNGWLAILNAIGENELPHSLTKRERDVAELAVEGKRNVEISEELFISENTVRAHLRSIYQKLDIDRRTKLVKKLK